MRLSILGIMILILFPFSAVSDKQEHPLVPLMNVIEESGTEVTGWDATMKEKISPKRAETIRQKLEKKYKIVEDQNEKRTLLQAINEQENDFQTITYTIIIPENDHHKAEVRVLIEGEHWDRNTEHRFNRVIENLHLHIFTGKAQHYACLQTDSYDKMNSVYLSQKWETDFQMLHKKTVTDSVAESRVEKVTYGYTPMWKDKITMKEKPVNLQFVKKETRDDRVRFLIGTPILINEY